MTLDVLFIHHGRVLGGAPRSLSSLVNGLQQSGPHKIAIACVNQHMREFMAGETSAQIEMLPGFNQFLLGRLLLGYSSLFSAKAWFYASLEILFFPLTFFMQRAFLKRLQPDIVHLNSAILLVPALTAWCCGYPVVWHIRERLLSGKWSMRRLIYRSLLIRIARQLVFISPAEAESFGLLKSPKTQIVHNSVDISEFNGKYKQALADSLKVTQGAHRFTGLTLGGSSFRKGLAEILEAYKHLGPEHLLLVAGACPEANEPKPTLGTFVNAVHAFEDLLRSCKLKDHRTWFYSDRIASLLSRMPPGQIEILGEQSDVTPLLARADFLIFAATTPHFPRPVFESWLTETPVITFNGTGIRHYLRSSAYGDVTNENTSRELQRLIEDLKREPERGLSSAALGKQLALQLFDQRRNAELVLEIYRTIKESEPAVH